MLKSYYCNRNKEEMKIDKAGLYSFMSFSWMTGLMWKAYKKGLTEDDIPKCSKLEMCHPNSQRFATAKYILQVFNSKLVHYF